jgi:heme/copper-type cytochrome/quinol oxidase subunit 2
MKQATKALYSIGNIFNLIAIIMLIVLGLLTILGANVIEDVPDGYDMSLEEYRTTAIILGVIMLIIAAIYIAVYVFAIKAKKAVDNNSQESKPHLIMIILALIGQNLFYLIGGILGLVDNSNDNKENE